MTRNLELTTSPPPDWDDWVEPSAPTLRTNWIELASHRLPHGFVALTARDDGGLSTAIGGTILPYAGRNPRLDPYQMLSGASRDQGLLPDGPHPWSGRPENELFPCLHLTLPNYETTVIGPHRDRPQALDDFFAGIETWARDEGCASIAVTYLVPDPSVLAGVLRRRGWFVATMTYTCDLRVTWKDTDGYLSTLRSKRRIAIRRESRALAERGVRLTSVPVTDADQDEMIRLRCQLLQKYGQRPDPRQEQAVLARLIRGFSAEELTVVRACAGDRLLGFTLMVRDGTTWTALMTGTDYTSDLSAYCYFATCYYEPARLAPDLGITLIRYGLGSWEAKRSRGCRLVPLSIAARSPHA